MELIPILSFIILVATISTFILAIGAYVLYKIRESKGKIVNAPKPQAVEAEIYTPAQALIRQQEPMQQKAYQEQYYQNIPYDAQRQVYTQAQQESMQQNQMRGGSVYNSGAQQEYKRPYKPSAQEDNYDQNTTDRKYMKYTSEGYIPVSKTKAGDNLKWR